MPITDNAIQLPTAELQNKLYDRILANNFSHFMGVHYTSVTQGLVQAELILAQQHLQHIGFAHGGVTATLCDTVSGFAAFTAVELHQQVVTLDLHVKYHRPGKPGKLLATGKVVKRGRMYIFTQSEITQLDAQSNTTKVIASATATMAIIQTAQ